MYDSSNIQSQHDGYLSINKIVLTFYFRKSLKINEQFSLIFIEN